MVQGSCGEAGRLLPQHLPGLGQRERDVRRLLPAPGRHELHAGLGEVAGALEECLKPLRPGLPHHEQPGAGALPAEQAVERPQHDAGHQAAAVHPVPHRQAVQGG